MAKKTFRDLTADERRFDPRVDLQSDLRRVAYALEGDAYRLKRLADSVEDGPADISEWDSTLVANIADEVFRAINNSSWVAPARSAILDAARVVRRGS